MKAIQLIPENFDAIIAMTTNVTTENFREELRTYFEATQLFNETAYFVPNYESKFGRALWPWAMVRSDYLDEEFDYTLPENPTQEFEITRK